MNPARNFGARTALLALAVAALLVAALDPHVEREQPVFNLMVAIDITQSMNTRDYRVRDQPLSRLAHVKQALTESLRQLPCGSRIGWAIFTEYRTFLLFTPVEVCANYRELVATLAGIDGRMSWAGASEIAKGFYSGLLIAKDLPGRPDLVFVTDGHEAPPINPNYRPTFNGKPGDVGGIIVGVGGDALLPIPKFDADGNPLGVWKADEVLQTDTRSLGRGGSVEGEAMAEEDEKMPRPGWMAPAGLEHLSSLREEYLQLLASETGLAYWRMPADQPAKALRQQIAPLLRPAVVETGLRGLFGLVALLMLLAAQIGGRLPRLAQIVKRGWQPSAAIKWGVNRPSWLRRISGI